MLCQGRGAAGVDQACSSCLTGGWREDPADEEELPNRELARGPG